MFLTTVLPPLLSLVTTSDPSLRHGALRAVSELTFALYKHAQSSGTSLKEALGDETIIKLLDIAPRVRQTAVWFIYQLTDVSLYYFPS